MSSLHYITTQGIAEEHSEHYHFSQAVILAGNVVKCAGQGGWDENGTLGSTPAEQIELTFRNIERLLRAAGLRGWEDVYSIRSFHVGIEEGLDLFCDAMRRYMPTHKPIWSAVGVSRLPLEGLMVEVEVEAFKRE